MTDSSEILEKFSGIGPQFERFLRDQNLVSRNSQDFLRNISLLIPEKFSALGHQFTEKFLGMGYEKLLRISIDRGLGHVPTSLVI